ncbi:MAG: YbbR-like domain-containing protein [Pyrinomonadaceae bacterium]
MPFQDIEETATAPRPPTPLERWVRKVFVEDWSLKLLALAITVTLWLAVTGQNKPVTLRVSGVQLNFLRPHGLEISNEPPGSVEVVLTGSPDKLDRIGPRDLVATVDLSDQKAGERVIRLSLERVKMDLREDVKIQGFHPTTIPIRLEPIIEISVDVEVKLEGKLPEGYAVISVSANPARVRLRGPSNRLKALHKAMTETVWLDGKTESFNLSHVEINVPDPKIDILDPAVDIHVEVAEKKSDGVHLRLDPGDRSPYLGKVLAPYSHRQ